MTFRSELHFHAVLEQHRALSAALSLPSEDFPLLNHSIFKPFERYSDRLLESMAHSDDLIEHANFLVDLNAPNDPKQVDLRRAVSAAYYALFHLLTSEAARNWKHDRHQTRLARIFDHKPMKTCSSSMASKQPPADPAKLAVFAKLKVVAENFVSLQQARYDADYDNARVWSRTQAYEEIVKAEVAVAAWATIREEEMAQDYLYDLLDSRRR